MNLIDPKLADVQRLDFHLGNWGKWMRSGELVRGYKHGAAGCATSGHIGDFDDMVAGADRRTAAIMDTLIADLVPVQSCAVHHVWINAVYRFKDEMAFDDAYSKACENLLIGMDHKGLW